MQFARDEAAKGKRVALYGLSSTAGSRDIEDHGPGRLEIVRLHVPSYDRTNVRARAWWTLKTNFRLLHGAFRDMRTASEIMFTGSPPLLLHFIGPLNVLLRKTLVYRITDFYPECLIAEYARTPTALSWLLRLTMFWRKRVTRFEVLGEDQRRRLLESEIPAERIILRRYHSPVSVDASTMPLPRPRELEGYKILLYSGNFGVAHDYATFLEGYRRHHGEGSGRVALWLNATGRGADILERTLKDHGLPHLRTRPVPLEHLGHLLATADAHLVTLREPFWGYVMPSKIHGCIDSGRPILYIGPEESDIALLGRSDPRVPRFIHVRNRDSEGVQKALEALANLPR